MNAAEPDKDRGGRRVLVTGLGTFWGGRVAQALEQDPNVDVIVGLDVQNDTQVSALDSAALTDQELLAGPCSWTRLPDQFPA